jgi:predicted ester cyclase
MSSTADLALEERNKQIVVDVYRRFDEQDATVFDEHPGLYETRLYLPRTWVAFPDLEGTVTRVMADGDLVAIHSVLRGTHQGPGPLGPPTGKAVEFQVIGIERLEDGRIVEHNAEAGWMNVFMQLGLIKV